MPGPASLHLILLFSQPGVLLTALSVQNLLVFQVQFKCHLERPVCSHPLFQVWLVLFQFPLECSLCFSYDTYNILSFTPAYLFTCPVSFIEGNMEGRISA